MKSPVTAVERRREPELRIVVEELYPRVASLYDLSRTWGGSALTTWVYRVVREAYPQLDALRVQIVVTAMQRLHRDRRARRASVQPAAELTDETV